MVLNRIKVENQTGSPQRYIMFQAAPETRPGTNQVWSNVWMTGVVPPVTGTIRFAFDSELQAFTGQASVAVAPMVKIQPTDYVAVTLATSTSVGLVPTVIVEEYPKFTSPPYGTISTKNSFGIRVDQYNPLEHPNVVIGMARNGASTVVPVFTLSAAPNTQYVFSPTSTYYIATGDYDIGEIIDPASLVMSPPISFDENSPYTTAVLSQQADGTYTPPTYYSGQ